MMPGGKTTLFSPMMQGRFAPPPGFLLQEGWNGGY